MAKKRPVPPEEDVEDEQKAMGSTDDEESEADVSMDDATEHDNELGGDGSVPFLDAFYGLASDSAVERSRSAQAMIDHCLLGTSANTKDSSYALRRLLNGLCSGRAGARQGYASALSSFLNISFKTGTLQRIQEEIITDSQGQIQPVLVFVRSQLIKATDPNQAEKGKFGKKKGSEERDYQFGRLFGILSVLRSGILTPDGSMDTNEISQVACDFARDLLELHNEKKWMKEPAAHGLITLLNVFYGTDSKQEAVGVADALVRKVVVPGLFGGASTRLTDLSSEQLAVSLHIQCHAHEHDSDLPTPLCDELFSSSTIPALTPALSLTSCVVHPRTHLVWDMIWQYLTEARDLDPARMSGIKHLKLKEACPVTKEKGKLIVKELVDSVIVQSLLRGQSQSNRECGQATHEQRALGLTLVKVLAGGVHQSTSIGSFVLDVDHNVLEKSILNEVVVRKLFVDVIGAGVGGGAKQSPHMLRPLALHVLELLVTSEIHSIVPENDVADAADNIAVDRRVLCAKCFLRCEPRFDVRTKTATISELLLFDEENVENPAVMQMWTELVSFLECQIFISYKSDEARHRAVGYVDMLFNTAKRFIRIKIDQAFSDKVIERVLGCFMCSAFLDCTNFVAEQETGEGIANARIDPKESTHLSLVESALRVKRFLGDEGCLPYAERLIFSSRFFSLLAETSSSAPSKSTAGSRAGSVTMQRTDARAFQVLSNVCLGWEHLLSQGGRPFASSGYDDDHAEVVVHNSFDPERFVFELQRKAVKAISAGDPSSNASEKCLVAFSVLASALLLHRLSCGSPPGIDDELESGDDGDNDDEEIADLLADVSEVLADLLAFHGNNGTVEGESPSPLAGLAEICVNILSSHFCAGSRARGGAPKLLRDAIRRVWTGSLVACTSRQSENEISLLNDDLLGVLLHSIGASAASSTNREDVDDDGSDEESENDAVFSTAAGEALDIDESDNDETSAKSFESPATSTVEGERTDDVEINSGQLQSLLLEDSDADISEEDEGVLEHHAGADAALAQLIRLKQDARKAGREARERLEISNNLRCIALIEILVSKVGNFLPSNFGLGMILPVLRLRKSTEKSLGSPESDLVKSSALENDKKVLLNKLTALLKSRVCKVRLSKHADREDVLVLVEDIMDEARHSNTNEHSMCCSTCLGAALKSLSDPDDKIAAAEVYNGALVEWTSKRTTKLQMGLFEDLILQSPGLAQVTLAAPLADALKESRSPFLKSESFRLITALIQRAKRDYDADAIDKRGYEHIRMASPALVAGIIDALHDDDMKKTKRVRDVLKATDKFLSFMKESESIDSSFLIELEKMRECLVSLKEASESTGVTTTCGKLISTLEELQCKGAAGPHTTESISGLGKKKKKKKRSKKK